MAEHSVACHYRTSGLNVQQQLLSTCRINKALPSWLPLFPIPEAERHQDGFASWCLLVWGRENSNPHRARMLVCCLTVCQVPRSGCVSFSQGIANKQMPVLVSRQVGRE